jgi:hypothetical protein
MKNILKKIAVAEDGRYCYWLRSVGNKFEILELKSEIIPTQRIPEAGDMVDRGIVNNEEEAIKALLEKYSDITILKKREDIKK